MMLYKKYVTASLTVLAIFLLIASVSACGKKESGEERIRAVIKEMIRAAEAKDIGGVKEHISRDYRDSEGNDYDKVKGIIAFYFLQQESINIFQRRTEVQVQDGEGRASVRAVISRGRKVEKPSDLLPSEAGGFVFDLTFRKEGGDWKLASAVWRQVGLGEAL